MSLRLAVQQPYTMARLPPQARGVAIHYNRRRDEDMRSQEEDRRRREDDEQRKKADENGFYSCSLPSPRPRPSHRLRDDSLLLSSFGTFVSYSSTKCFSPAFPIPCPGRYTAIMQRMETVLEWLCFLDWPVWPTSRQAADTVAFVLIWRHRANAKAQLRCISDFSLDALQRIHDLCETKGMGL